MNNINVISSNELEFLGKRYKCAIGEKGFTDTPLEGDKKTPLGRFALRECWYRADRIDKPDTMLPLKIIKQDDGWCDSPEHTQYNLHVKLPVSCSHERLWREDNIYDIIVPIGFNDTDIIPGNGSAIFFHIAKPDYQPTLGCVAVSLPNMLEILKNIYTASEIVISCG